MGHNIKSGVATANEVQEIFAYAKKNGFALPAVNVKGLTLLMPYWKPQQI